MATPTEVQVTVAYNGGDPTVIPDTARVRKGGRIAFLCADASLVIVCQYNRKGAIPKDHCPFSRAGSVFSVPQNQLVSHRVKNTSAIVDTPYKYTIVMIPDSDGKMRALDPTIIIKQT